MDEADVKMIRKTTLCKHCARMILKVVETNAWLHSYNKKLICVNYFGDLINTTATPNEE